MLTAFLMAGDSIGSNAPTYGPRSNSNSKKPVTTEPSIDPNLRTKIEAVHNSVSGHFDEEYTRKVLLGRGVDDDGLRRAVTKFVRDCPVCQLIRSVLNSQIKTHRFTTASYTPMEVLNIDTIGPVSKDSANNCYILVIIDCFTRFVELYPVSDTSALFLYPVIPAKRDDNLANLPISTLEGSKPNNKSPDGGGLSPSVGQAATHLDPLMDTIHAHHGFV
jgi:hypothetical protein